MRKASCGALAVALLAAPAAADWLVTRDGGRVETRGPWQVKGRLVVFTRAEGSANGAPGQLASLRITDIDWAASERATAAAAEARTPREAKSPPPEAPQESRWVLTDDDFQRPAPPPAPVEGEAPAAEETDAAGRPRIAVVLEGWERRDHPDGLEIAGTLRNPGSEIAAEVGVTVRLYDETGALLATGEGRIATASLGPGATTPFRAAFPGVFTYAEAKLDVRGFGLRLKAVEEVTPGTAEPPPGRVP